jgi:hypothetical protein
VARRIADMLIRPTCRPEALTKLIPVEASRISPITPNALGDVHRRAGGVDRVAARAELSGAFDDGGNRGVRKP